MADDGRFSGWLQRAARKAGRRYGEVRQSYRDGRAADEPELSTSGTERLPTPDLSYLPRDAGGDARLVCRRHAEKRAVAVDEHGRPDCFDAEHPDCQGCVQDVRDGVVETW